MFARPATRDVANLDVFEPSLAPLEVHIEGPRLRQEDGESASQAGGRPSPEVGGGPFPVLENVAHRQNVTARSP